MASVRDLDGSGDLAIDDLRAIAAALSALATADRELIRAVQNARAHGQSWSRIARALGTSKQSAIERYASTANASAPRSTGSADS